jgi:hypothetical protein
LHECLAYKSSLVSTDLAFSINLLPKDPPARNGFVVIFFLDFLVFLLTDLLLTGDSGTGVGVDFSSSLRQAQGHEQQTVH